MKRGISRCAIVLACVFFVAVQGRWVEIPDDQPRRSDNFDNSNGKFIVRDHKIIRNDKQFREDGPPDHTKYAQMARYIVHNAEYVAMGTISTIPQLAGYPFVNILSTADGPRGRNGKSTGTPYFYTTKLDFSAADLSKDNRLTVMMSLAQQGYCQEHDLDAEDPRCARIMLSGKLVRVQNGTEEYDFAYNSLAERHPIMKTWPQDHNFFLAKLKIASVAVLDWFGGPHYVPIDEYYKTSPYDEVSKGNELFDSEEIKEIKFGDDVDDRRYVSMMG